MKAQCGLKVLCRKVEPGVTAELAWSAQSGPAGGVMNCPVFGVWLNRPSHALLSDSEVDRFIGYFISSMYLTIIFYLSVCLVLLSQAFLLWMYWTLNVKSSTLSKVKERRGRHRPDS